MSNSYKYKGIVFDLDGTLVNSLEDLADSMNEVLVIRGFPPHAIDSYKYHVGDGLKNLVIRTLPNEHKEDYEMVKTCMEEMRHIYNGRWNRKSRLYQDVPELLTELSKMGVKLAICSNKPDNFTQNFYNYFLKNWNFASVIGAQQGLPLKPDPASTLESAKKLEIPTDNLLYLGDTSTDMITAKNAGIRAVGALWGFRNKEELLKSGADVIIAHPLELLSLID